jgi:hypothetical protein
MPRRSLRLRGIMAPVEEIGVAAAADGTARTTLLDLPPELLQLILSYLDAKALARVARVCAALRENADAEHLWRDLCRQRWQGKTLMVHEVQYRANLAHPAAAAALTVGELKHILRMRRVPVDGVLREKSDLVAAVRRSCPEVAFRVPLHSKWKASYAAAELDARRCELTMDELTAYPWRFQFKQQRDMSMVSRFTKDFRYHSLDHNFDWRFYGQEYVQVAQFPPLRISRTADDWGWQLENHWVIFTLAPELKDVQFTPPPPEAM